MTLAATQRWLAELIRAPEGVAKALAQSGVAPAKLAEVVVGADADEAIARLDVYANMYFFRILEALGTDYPRLAMCLGDGLFSNVVTEYLWVHPSTEPSLREVGRALPAFLADDTKSVDTPPWAADLARLERAHVEVFDAVDGDTLAWESLQTLPAEAFGTLPLRTIAALRIVEVAWDAVAWWDAGVDAEAPAPDDDGALAEPAFVVVWRRDRAVLHRTIDARERRFLQLVQDGTTFGIVCEELAQDKDEAEAEEDAAQAAFALLGRWVADGLLRADAQP